MGRRALIAGLAVLLAVTSADAAGRKAHKGGGAFTSSVGLNKGLTFHAPLTDPANPSTIYTGTGPFTFTRAHDATHTATYLHPTTGLVTTASAGQLRIEAGGAVLEDAGTNIAQNTASLTGPFWSYLNTTISTTDNTIAPDGTLTAVKVKETNASSFIGIITQRETTPGKYTHSAYIKAAERTAAVLELNDTVNIADVLVDLTDCSTSNGPFAEGAITDKTFGALALDNGWCRVWVTATHVDQTGTPLLRLWLTDTPDHQGDNTAGLYVWGVMMSAGGLQSYIPNPADVTAMSRNADVLTFPTASNVDDTAGTISFTVELSDTVDVHGWISGEAHRPIYSQAVSGTGDLHYYDGTNNALFGLSDVVAKTPAKWAIRYGGVTIDVYKDGSPLQYVRTFDGDYDFGSFMRVGADALGRYLGGHMKNLRVWNRALSDAEMKALTQ